MKKIFILLTIVSLALFSCKSGNKSQEAEAIDSTQVQTQIVDTMKIEKVEEPILDIKTSMGTIRVKLYKETPLHRDNFMKLVSTRFFDGILFHRVIYGFMIQAGDPLTKNELNVNEFGTGGPGYTIPAEIIPELKHKKGALAAARRGDTANPKRESSGSQFYIVQNENACAQLDGAYTVFGETISGLDVVDKIASVQTNERDLPKEPIKILEITQVVDEK
jgi:Peptidyl-prolyl cis-trans isomerase (rotamase) - cyclophilin family